MTPNSAVRLAGATVLCDGQMARCDLSVAGGRIADSSATDGARVIDLPGRLILPGIVDLNGEASGCQAAIAWDDATPAAIDAALVAIDRDAAASGVTTAWLSQGWSWEGGSASPEHAEAVLAAHRRVRPTLLADMRIKLRIEAHTVQTEACLIAAMRRFGVDYAVFDDGLVRAEAIAARAPWRVADWAARMGRRPEAQMAALRAARADRDRVPRYLCNLATAFDGLGVRYGSHGDTDGQTRERYAMIGAKICEAPASASAAAVARTWGDPVLMAAAGAASGAMPAGIPAATTLIRDGMCDALVSGGCQASLAAAAFRLVGGGLLTLPRAWAMISTAPARIMGLHDRGVIAPGRRADLAVVDPATGRIEATMAAGRWTFVSAALARIGGPPRGACAVAAE